MSNTKIFMVESSSLMNIIEPHYILPVSIISPASSIPGENHSITGRSPVKCLSKVAMQTLLLKSGELRI